MGRGGAHRPAQRPRGPASAAPRSAGGDASLAQGRSQVGLTEYPPGSNQVPYWDWWGCGTLGSWCAVFTSWCCGTGGYPLPGIQGSCSDATGYISCDYATEYAWLNVPDSVVAPVGRP